MPGIDRLQAEESDEAGRIVFEAFKDIADKHGFPPGFVSVHRARRAIQFLGSIEQVASFAARDPWLQGVTLISVLDEIAGIGPVAVDLDAQGKGLGRKLMVAAMDEARAQGHTRIRLMQEAFNVTSLSLYASLDFQVVEPLAEIRMTPAGEANPVIRAAGADELDELAALYARHTGMQRGAELALTARGQSPLVYEDDGKVTGFVVGFQDSISFGSAETNQMLVDLARAHSERSACEVQWLLPMRFPNLLQDALAGGGRVAKMANLMAYGPYDEPVKPHIVSFWY